MAGARVDRRITSRVARRGACVEHQRIVSSEQCFDGVCVDHALCRRVTDLLSDYQREFEISVSSPGIARPLRTPQHFRNVVGRRVALRTEAKRRVRGEVVDAGEQAVTVRTQNESVDIPYEAIVRGNLIDEG